MQQAAQKYYQAKLPIIPLPEGSKNPPPKGFPDTPTEELFTRCHFYPNVGMIAGGDHRLVFLDNDGLTTFDDHQAYFHANGLPADRYPATRSVSGPHRGAMIFRTDDLQAIRDHTGNEHKKHFENKDNGHIGYGPGAYIALPPSYFSETGKSYTWRQEFTGLDDIPIVPAKLITDLLPTGQAGPRAAKKAGIEQPDHIVLDAAYRLAVQVLYRPDLPSHAIKGFDWLKTASRGAGYSSYATRSEYAMSLCMTMALAGWQFTDVLSYFRIHTPGYLADIAQPEAFLKTTWYSALDAIEITPPRPEIANLLLTLDGSHFGKYSQKPVMLALLQIAYVQASYTIDAPQREIKRLAGIKCRKTVRNALHGLIDDGWIERLSKGGMKQPAVYRLDNVTTFPQKTHVLSSSLSHSGNNSEKREEKDMSFGGRLSHYPHLDPAIHSMFWKIVSQSQTPQQVYYLLKSADRKLTANEIAAMLGTHKRTAIRALARLADNDLIINYFEAGYEVSGIELPDHQLIEIAQGIDQDQIKQIRYERNRHRKALRYQQEKKQQ